MRIKKVDTTTAYSIELSGNELSRLESALAIADGEIPRANANYGELREEIEEARQL